MEGSPIRLNQNAVYFVGVRLSCLCGLNKMNESRFHFDECLAFRKKRSMLRRDHHLYSRILRIMSRKMELFSSMRF